MKQPDFTQLFFDTFKDCPAAVHYKVRSDSNFQHDIHFLYCLVKDARFTLADIRHEKQTLVIPLCRQRSELWQGTSPPKRDDMNSELRFTRVRKIEWTASQVTHKASLEGTLFNVDDAIGGRQRCEIDALFVGESSREPMRAGVEIVIAGYHGWRLRIGLAHEGWTISVKDGNRATL